MAVIVSKLNLVPIRSLIPANVDIRKPRHKCMRKVGQIYHLKDEGHCPTYANRLVKAQLQILLRGENVKEKTNKTKTVIKISSQRHGDT